MHRTQAFSSHSADILYGAYIRDDEYSLQVFVIKVVSHLLQVFQFLFLLLKFSGLFGDLRIAFLLFNTQFLYNVGVLQLLFGQFLA